MNDNKNLNNHDYHLLEQNKNDYEQENENYLTGHEFYNDEHKPKLIYKTFVLAVVVIFLFTFNNYLKGLTKNLESWTGNNVFSSNQFSKSQGETGNICYNDIIFNDLEDINSNYAEQNYQRHALLITSSIAMDVSVYASFFVFVKYSKNWVFLIALFLFYGVRQLMLSLFVFRFPEGYIFDAPSISSLTVSYFKTNDFFYSGHIGILIIIFLEFRAKMINKFVSLIILLVACLESFTMLALRGHYFVDILFGIVMGIYCYRKSKLVEKFLINYMGLMVEDYDDIEFEKTKVQSKLY